MDYQGRLGWGPHARKRGRTEHAYAPIGARERGGPCSMLYASIDKLVAHFIFYLWLCMYLYLYLCKLAKSKVVLARTVELVVPRALSCLCAPTTVPCATWVFRCFAGSRRALVARIYI